MQTRKKAPPGREDELDQGGRIEKTARTRGDGRKQRSSHGEKLAAWTERKTREKKRGQSEREPHRKK